MITKKLFWVFTISTILLFANACSKDENIVTSPIEVDNNNNTATVDQSEFENEILLYSIKGDDLSPKAIYNVKNKDLEYQKDVEKHQQIWTLVKKIIPSSYRNKLKEFLIYKGEVDGSAGFVVELKKDLSEWQMGIAIDFAYDGGFNTDGELAYTIIHEFGHILTLDNTQLNSSISQNDCTNYFPGEGCAEENSYINELQKLYWADIWSEFEQAGDDETKQDEFYNKHKTRFVTQYASTNPAEDIAEVFSTFVTQKNKPTGNTIADKKILLMYNRAELVSLRNSIRQNTASRAKGLNTSFKLPKPGAWKKANTFGNPKKTH